MTFYKQIPLIALFVVIHLLFFIPHYNNIIIVILKSISSIGLMVLIALYAFPNLLKSKKNEDTLNSSKLIPKKNQEYSFIDQRYSALLENIKKGILSVNESYACGIYVIDQTSEAFELKSSSGVIFKSNLELGNPLLSQVLSSGKSKIIKYKDIKPAHWNELISYDKWKGSESAFCFPIKNSDYTIGALIVFIKHFSKINPVDIDVIQKFVEILNQGIFDIWKSESQILINKNSSLIHDLFKTFDPESDSDEFFKSVKNTCRSIFKYDKLTISLKSIESDELNVIVTDGFDEDIEEGFSYNPRKLV